MTFLKVCLATTLFVMTTCILTVHKSVLFYLGRHLQERHVTSTERYTFLASLLLIPQILSFIHLVWNVSFLTKAKHRIFPGKRKFILDLVWCVVEPFSVVTVAYILASRQVSMELIYLMATPVLSAFLLKRNVGRIKDSQTAAIKPTRNRLRKALEFLAISIPPLISIISGIVLSAQHDASWKIILCLVSCLPSLGQTWSHTLGVKAAEMTEIQTARRLHYLYALIRFGLTCLFLYAAWQLGFEDADHIRNSNLENKDDEILNYRYLLLLSVILTASVSKMLYFLTLSFCHRSVWLYFPTPLSILLALSGYAVKGLTSSDIKQVNLPFLGLLLTVDSPSYLFSWFLFVILVISVLVSSLYIIYKGDIIRTHKILMTPYDKLFNDYWLDLIFPDIRSILSIAYCSDSSAPVKDKINLKKPKKSFIFACATMYREKKEEMRTLIASLSNLANEVPDIMPEVTLAAHIFFDGGCFNKELSLYAKQLIAVLQEDVESEYSFYGTDYGFQFRTFLHNKTPLVVHFKDNTKFKNRKRWSQAMYMQYVLNFFLKNQTKSSTESQTPLNSQNEQALYQYSPSLFINGDIGKCEGKFGHLRTTTINVNNLPETNISSCTDYSVVDFTDHTTDLLQAKENLLTESAAYIAATDVTPKINCKLLNGTHSLPMANGASEFHFEKEKLAPELKGSSYAAKDAQHHNVYDIDPEDGNEEVSLDNAYILALDGDIQFRAESVYELYAVCRGDGRVGGACGRTHPRAVQGHSISEWYQKIEYALDFWMIKNSQNVIGSVTCCPGCFALFRANAIKDIIQKVCEPTMDGADVYFKDIGEDRWITSLLIFRGWHVKYVFQAMNVTYCPVTFPEFMRQRKRWILSDLSNDVLLLSKSFQLVKKNQTTTMLFMALTALLFMWKSLIIAQSIFTVSVAIHVFTNHAIDFNLVATIFSSLVAFYTIACLTTSGTNVARLTICFGILTGIIYFVVVLYNVQIAIDMVLYASPFSWRFYLFLVIVILFVIPLYAGCMHPRELSQLRFYVICILFTPLMLIFMPIYSICNIGDQRWGTRDGTANEDKMMCCQFPNPKFCGGGYSKVRADDDDETEDSVEVEEDVDTSDDFAQNLLANVKDMDDVPELHEEAKFWKKMKKTYFGTDANKGPTSDFINGHLKKLRLVCVTTYISLNVVVIFLLWVTYTAAANTDRTLGYKYITAFLLFALLKTIFPLIGMTVHHILTLIQATAERVYGRDFPMWRPQKSLSSPISEG